MDRPLSKDVTERPLDCSIIEDSALTKTPSLLLVLDYIVERFPFCVKSSH